MDQGYLKILYWRDVADNPDNVPGDVVAQIVHVRPDEVVSEPWVRMTVAQYKQLGAANSRKRLELAKLIRERAGELEQAGIEVNGVKIDTTRDSQAMLSGAVSYMRLLPDAEIDWQSPDGTFTKLGKAQVEGVALLVGQHVQRHFTRRKELMQMLAALPDDQLNDFRDTIEQFWEE